jgi:serine protease Do
MMTSEVMDPVISVERPSDTLRTDLASIAERLRRSTVLVRARGGQGSGIVASADGLIVTNAHVAGNGRMDVVASDGDASACELLATAPERDLALLKISRGDLVPVVFRDSRTLRPGEIVIAVGNPLGLVGAVSAGVVHSADPRGRRVVADVRILPGNSGGPLADAGGAVVGVNAMVADGLAVAIACGVVQRFIASPGARPHLGIVARPVSLSIMGQQRPGMLVVEAAGRGPAARAGVLIGDVIFGVDGRCLDEGADLGDVVDGSAVGSGVRLDIVRAGQVIGIEVVVGDAAARRLRAA